MAAFVESDNQIPLISRLERDLILNRAAATIRLVPVSYTHLEMPRALYPLASQRETIRSADFGKWENNLSSVIIQM